MIGIQEKCSSDGNRALPLETLPQGLCSSPWGYALASPRMLYGWAQGCAVSLADQLRAVAHAFRPLGNHQRY